MNRACCLEKQNGLAQTNQTILDVFDLNCFSRYLLTNRYLNLVRAVSYLRHVECLLNAFSQIDSAVVERTLITAKFNGSFGVLLTQGQLQLAIFCQPQGKVISDHVGRCFPRRDFVVVVSGGRA